MIFSIVTAHQTFSLHETRIIKADLRLKGTLSPRTLAHKCDMQYELMPVRSSHLEKLRGSMYVPQNNPVFSFFLSIKSNPSVCVHRPFFLSNHDDQTTCLKRNLERLFQENVFVLAFNLFRTHSYEIC